MTCLLSYREARAVLVREVNAAAKVPATQEIALTSAGGRVLASDIHADRDYPSLDRTARDGFAVRSFDMPGRARVTGEVRAGERFAGVVGPGEAVEIMTGAPVPLGADAIVMVEHVVREGEFITYSREAPPGQFINVRGGESSSGSALLCAGTRISYTEIALLAAVGCVRVPVFVCPRVAIVATGDELVRPEASPEPHQIRNSNAYSLAAQVTRAGGDPTILGVAPDRLDATRELVEHGLTLDLLLLSGGVSAGKYDVVEDALKSLGAEFFFDAVAIQPGKPLVFGRAQGRFFFGLPGNPASTMVTFEIFARTVVEMLAGQAAREPLFLNARITCAYKHRGGLQRFLPAWVSADGALTPIPWTGSADIAALTRANAFMVVDADREVWNAGDTIQVLLK